MLRATVDGGTLQTHKERGIEGELFTQIANATVSWVGVTRVDIKETVHGFLWVVDWQELCYGEA